MESSSRANEHGRLCLMLSTKYHVLRYVCDNPSSTSNEIAEALNVSRRTVSQYLAELRREGLIVRRKILPNLSPWYNYATDNGERVYSEERTKRGVLCNAI